MRPVHLCVGRLFCAINAATNNRSVFAEPRDSLNARSCFGSHAYHASDGFIATQNKFLWMSTGRFRPASSGSPRAEGYNPRKSETDQGLRASIDRASAALLESAISLFPRSPKREADAWEYIGNYRAIDDSESESSHQQSGALHWVETTVARKNERRGHAKKNNVTSAHENRCRVRVRRQDVPRNV